MNQLITNFLQELARTTRFNFLGEDADVTTQDAPRSRWMQVLIRAVLGVAYLIIALLMGCVFSQPVAAVLLAAAVILALHFWITAGRECRLMRNFQQAWLPETLEENGPNALTLLFQCLPALLLLALLGLRAAIWLPTILALGAAGGRELARKTNGITNCDWLAWLVALVTMLLTLVCPCLGDALMRPIAIRSTLLVLILTFLLIPWLRLLPKRPAGFLANSLLVSAVVTVMVLLLQCL